MMKRLCIFFAIFLSCVKEGSAEIQCIGYYVGNNVTYQQSNIGDAFNKFSSTLTGRWAGGSQSSKYLSWQTVSGSNTAYAIAIPKTVDLNVSGLTYKIYINPQDTFDIPGSADWQAFKVNETREGCAVNTKGLWESRGAAITGGSTSFNVQGRPLPTGSFTLSVPYILAWGTSNNETHDYLAKKIWDYVGVGEPTGTFNIKMVVQNNCDISDLNLTFDHGKLTPDEIDNHRISKKLSVTCSSDATIRFSLTDSSPTASGIRSNMKLISGGKDVSILQGRDLEIDVISTLEKIDGYTVIEGPFEMSTILMVEYV